MAGATTSSVPDVRTLTNALARLTLSPTAEPFVPTVKPVRSLKADALEFIPGRASHHVGFEKLPDKLQVKILRLVIRKPLTISARNHQILSHPLIQLASVSQKVRGFVYEIY
jgi:hypothetical protein